MMTAVLQWNLDGSGIRQRFRVGPGNVWLCGDSLSSPLVVKQRFFAAFLRAFKWPLRGLYIPAARLGGGGTDGMAVLHPATGEDVRGSEGPDDAGQFSLVDFPMTVLLPMARYERKWSDDSADGNRIGETEIEGDGISKPGGTYEWAAGDWLTGQSVSVGLVYVTHPSGLDGVRLQTRIRAASVNSGSPLNTDKVAINTYSAQVGIAETVAAFGAEVSGSVIPSDWEDVGFKLAAPTDSTDETGKGIVKLFGHVYVDDVPDGVQFGVLADAGLTTEDWMARTDPDLLAEFIETTKADTFVFMFGANDSASKTKAQYKADIQAAIDMIVTASTTARGNDGSILPPKFLLVAVYEVQGRAVLADYADALLEISQSETYKDKAAFINLHKLAGAFNIIDTTLLDDGTHQTEVGGITLSQMLWNEIDTVRPTVSGFADEALTQIENIPGAMLDETNAVETGLTVRQSLRVMTAALAGRLTGAGGSMIKVRDVNDAKDRITATVDEAGNRTMVTIDKD